MTAHQRLIVGASSGLGHDLLKLYKTHPQTTVIGVSRKIPSEKPCERFYAVDMSNADAVNDFCTTLTQKNISLSSVIYCASEWGESGDIKTDKVISFMKSGPLGFITLINALMETNLLAEESAIISIGSTATLINNSIMFGTNSPMYSMAKEMQRLVSFEFQRRLNETHRRFTTLTLGGLGADRIQSEDVKSLIDCIETLSPNCRPVEIIMPARTDLRMAS